MLYQLLCIVQWWQYEDKNPPLDLYACCTVHSSVVPQSEDKNPGLKIIIQDVCFVHWHHSLKIIIQYVCFVQWWQSKDNNPGSVLCSVSPQSEDNNVCFVQWHHSLKVIMCALFSGVTV